MTTVFTLNLSIPNRYDHVGLATRCVLGLAGDLLGADAGVFETAMGEALNNVIEHSYPPDAEATVEIELRFDETGLELHIEDRGRGMEPEKFWAVPAQLDFDALDLQSLPEGGMGLCIIKMVADEVDYVREDGINRLTMRRRVRAA